MSKKSLDIFANWDAEAGVWWAVSDDIPGLVAEAGTLDELKAEITRLAPDLLELNNYSERIGLPIRLTSTREEDLAFAM